MTRITGRDQWLIVPMDRQVPLDDRTWEAVSRQGSLLRAPRIDELPRGLRQKLLDRL